MSDVTYVQSANDAAAETLVREKWRRLKATMDERQRRLRAGAEPERSVAVGWPRWLAQRSW